jgi:hypothetical protein
MRDIFKYKTFCETTTESKLKNLYKKIKELDFKGCGDVTSHESKKNIENIKNVENVKNIENVENVKNIDSYDSKKEIEDEFDSTLNLMIRDNKNLKIFNDNYYYYYAQEVKCLVNLIFENIMIIDKLNGNLLTIANIYKKNIKLIRDSIDDEIVNINKNITNYVVKYFDFEYFNCLYINLIDKNYYFIFNIAEFLMHEMEKSVISKNEICISFFESSDDSKNFLILIERLFQNFLINTEVIYLNSDNIKSICLPIILKNKHIIYSEDQNKLDNCKSKLCSFTTIIDCSNQGIISNLLSKISYIFTTDKQIISFQNYVELI